MIEGKCRLCGELKPLCDKSHIIPNWMYRRIKGSAKAMEKFSLTRLDGKLQLPQSGEWEGGILCQTCDGGIISSYEKYAQAVLYPKGVKQHERIYEGVDYTLIKLFFLSILWRASISSRQFFHNVHLDIEHQEKLRAMIHAGIPGQQFEYPVTIMGLDINDKLASIAQPRTTPSADTGKEVVWFIVEKLLLSFSISTLKEDIPDFMTNDIIKPNNRLDISIFPPRESIEFFKYYSGRKT